MSLFLQILGGIFCFLIVFVVLLRVGLQLLARKVVSVLKDAAGESGGTPARIHLAGVTQPTWTDAAAVRRNCEVLERNGLALAGVYCLQEMPGIQLQAYASPEQGVHAIVYEHPKVGVWLDLVTRYQDGSSVTFANPSRGGELDHRPGHDKVYALKSEPAALWDRFIAERPQRPMAEHTVDGFVRAFEQAYADEMDWRNSRGGPTEDEIRRVAAASGREAPSEETVGATQHVLALRARANLREGLLARFEEQGAAPSYGWDRERTAVVHDGMSPEEVRAEFESWNGAPPGVHPVGVPAREGFRRLNEALPVEQRYKLLGQIAEPVAAEFYAPPG